MTENLCWIKQTIIKMRKLECFSNIVIVNIKVVRISFPLIGFS